MVALPSPHGFGTGLTGAHAQMFFALVAIVGLALIVVWGVKFANRDQIRHAITWLLVLGVVGMFLTLPLARMGGRWMTFCNGSRWENAEVRPDGRNTLKGRTALPSGTQTSKSAGSATR